MPPPDLQQQFAPLVVHVEHCFLVLLLLPQLSLLPQLLLLVEQLLAAGMAFKTTTAATSEPSILTSAEAIANHQQKLQAKNNAQTSIKQ